MKRLLLGLVLSLALCGQASAAGNLFGGDAIDAVYNAAVWGIDTSNSASRKSISDKIEAMGGGAPTGAKYIVQQAHASLSAEQALGVLATGILKSTTTTGVLSIAIAGTDYLLPNGSGANLSGIPLDSDFSSAGLIKRGLPGVYSIATEGTDYLAGSRIDDTKGNGDAGYVWSADKVFDQFALKQPLESTLTDIADGTITENLENTAHPWADNEVANDLTIAKLQFDHNVETLAANKTLIITNKVIQKLDPDGTDRDILLPAEATATDLTFFIYNMGGEVGEDLNVQDDAAVDILSIGYLQLGFCTCDGTTWTVRCFSCAEAACCINLRAKEENTSAIVIGQPVYISGATGTAFPNIGLADCDDSTKIRVRGLAAEGISQNSTGYIRIKGLLEDIDSTKGGSVNPLSQDWVAGDQLWVSTIIGGLTNVRPIGRSIKVGTALTVEGASGKILVDVRENSIYTGAASGEDIICQMGDSAGSNKIAYQDFAGNEVASIDSDGNAEFTGISVDASAIPTLYAKDSGAPGTDKDGGSLWWNYIDGADGSENFDFGIKITQGGTEDVSIIEFDESDDRWESVKSFLTTGTLTGGTLTDGTFSTTSGAVTGVASATFADADASPNAVGEMQYDNTVTGQDDGSFAWYDDDEIKYFVTIPTASMPGDAEDDYLVAYDKDTDKYYFKADADSGGATAWDDIGNPDNDGLTTIDFNHASENTIFTNIYDAAGSFFKIDNTDADLANNVYLFHLEYTDDGQVNADFFKCTDNNGDVKFSIQEEGNTVTGTLTTVGDIKQQFDAAAFLTISTSDGGASIISQTSDGQDQIIIGDGSDSTIIKVAAGADAMADDNYSGIVLSGWNCGEGITQWDTVYLDDTSNEWMQADADAAGEFPARGVAVAGCTDGNPGIILVQGTIRNDGWTWTGNGKTLYLSDTVAGMTETAPSTANDCVQVVGFTLNDDTAYVNFSGHWLLVE